MMTRQPVSAVWKYLPVLLLVVACSNDEAPSSQENAAQSAAVVAASDAQPSTGFDPIKEYDAQCPDDDEDQTLECDWLHALVVTDVVEALEAIEHARDKRGVEEALAALDLDDEPEILIAALRILGQFPDSPGIAEKVTPLLVDSPYLQVQKMAAQLLGRNRDPILAAMAEQWSQNHEALIMEDPYDMQPDLPPQYAAMEFPEYPGAARFTLADSDRSVGWWSSDAPSKVSDWLAEELDAEAMDYMQWMEHSQQQMMNVYQTIDQSKLDEVQRLSEEFGKTQDPNLLERIDSLQQEINAPMQQIEVDVGKTVDKVTMPPVPPESGQIYYLIAEEKDGHSARVIVVYRQPVIERTVIQTAWDLRDYPPAWGDAR